MRFLHQEGFRKSRPCREDLRRESGVILDTVFVGPTPRLAVSVAGQGSLVLFLHGIGGNRHSWDGQVEFFSPRFKAAAWDARGYGDSEDYAEDLDFSVFSGDILRVLSFFAAEKAHIVGLSMGGRIARNFALAHPERVKSLTLANTSPGFGALSPEKRLEFVELRRRLNPVAQAKRLLGPAAPPEAFDRVVAGLRAVHPESYLKTVEASVAQDLAAPVENLRVPTLVVIGSQDALYPPAIGEDMARRIPGARLVELDCGHLSNLETPARFNATVLEFLLQREK